MNAIEKWWRLFILKSDWRKRRKDQPVVDLTRTAGYFFPVGLITYNPLSANHLIQMSSNKLMRAKLLSYELYSDPADMIKEASYQYIGYANEKDFKDMTWKEYKETFLCY